ncbi:ATP-dependent RNA helicase HrpA [Cardiobacterium hominis]
MTAPDFTAVLCRDRHALRQLHRQIRERERRGQPTDRLRARFAAEYAASTAAVEARRAALPQPKLAADLPVLAAKNDILRLIHEHQVVIISGETGSGKTTQLPQLCLALGLGARGTIAHTQPRRIAARSVAARIAEELDTPLGDAVGYQVRFDEKTSDATVIKLMTDGMLLAETLSDPYLAQYEVIIVDEAHERSLNIDFLLGYLHRLAARRPDLKIIITSATIDAEKFAAHFGGAPVLNVSGRTYPVEIRYRPPGEDEDTADAILRAVAELDQHGRNDILVFLPSERDIREAADRLRREQLRDTDVLPLFGRLSLADQQAVFRPQAPRRIVLATNVAETSLTVPRIKAVIDTGTARISRYSLRTKTQRLPIEPISQAAANQRAGRCGRVSSGICIRLYSEEDYAQRPAYTEPEILRTNLAAIILQMLVLKLGDIAAFPFVDAPDERQINNGYRLLFELQATDESRRLTPLGRQMARLPVDPRFARILVAAEKTGCLQDALILVAALSIQDPRERPFGQEARADQKQGEFADKSSDYQTLLNLFAAYQRERRSASNNRLRQWCKSYYLNPQRMREWRELVNQLLRDSREQKLQLDSAHPIAPKTDLPDGAKGRLALENPQLETLHRALLTGFLDQVGLWDEQNRDYLRPRHSRFSLFPASVLAKKPPQAVMAASIVETQRTYARTCAPIQLAELEHLAAHLTRHQYSNPHWSKKAGNVLASQTTTLYGLPIVAGRNVPYARHDPALAHEIFIHDALVPGELNTRLKIIAQNRALIETLEEREHKTRSRGILADENQQAAFYMERLPEDVHSVITLEQWAKKHGEAALAMKEADLLLSDETIDEADYPTSLTINGQKLRLEYHFDPGGAADGITVNIPLPALNALDARAFERLVPAMLPAKIEALLRALPKVWRRQLVPIPAFAQAVNERIAGSDAPLHRAIVDAIHAIKGTAIPEDALDDHKIDDHHRMNYRLLDAKNQPLAESRDLAALQAEYSDSAAAQFRRRSQSRYAGAEAVHDWQWDELPAQETLPNGITGYPALTLEDGKHYLRLHDDPEQAAQAHRLAVHALLADKLQGKIKYLRKNLPGYTQMALHYRKIGSDSTLADDIIARLLAHVCLQDGVPRTRTAWEAALTRGERELIPAASELATKLTRILAAYSDAKQQLHSLKQPAIKSDIEAHLARLIYPAFIRDSDSRDLDLIDRALAATLKRIEKARLDPLKDLQRQKELAPWEATLQQALAKHGMTRASDNPPRGTPASTRTALLDYWRLTEAWRIQTYAQELGSPLKASPKRLQEAAEKLR